MNSSSTICGPSTSEGTVAKARGQEKLWLVDAAQMLEYTQCDYVMVGRGACGAPWIFMQINAYLSETRVVHTPPVSHRMLALIKQVELMIKYKGEYIGIREARKHASYYMKGLKGAAAYRRECALLCSLEQLHELCFRICKENE